MLVHPPRLVAAAVAVVNLVVKRAVGTLRHAVLLDHVRVEGLAFLVARAVAAVLLVVRVLGLGVAAADVDVKGAGEELGAHAVLGVVDGTLGALSWLAAAWRGGGEGVVGFLVAVGAGDDDVEVSAVAAEVVGGGGLDAGAPKGALEVRDGGWLGAVCAGVEAGVTLDVEVEARAEGGVVAPCGAVLSAVAGQGVQTEVGVCGDGGVEINKGLSVAVRGPCGSSKVVELRVGFEGVGGVGADFGTVTWVGLV